MSLDARRGRELIEGKTKEKGSKTGSDRESNTEGVGRNGELEGRKDNLI
jgi:hypothetical protein